jgi:branched-chain amino acid transport system substrate-binding protein
MPSMAPAQAANDIKIGIITSSSGPLGSYGLAYNDGLAWGLNYYTGGKMSVNGAKLVVTTKDDAADPASATATFKESYSLR